MDNQKENLISCLELYLRKNEFDDDLCFYEIDEWLKRGEDCLNDSEFVVTSEGSLHFMLNYGDADEFYDLIQSFGYYMDKGSHWCYGFYRDANKVGSKSDVSKSYKEKLQDSRWKSKRDKVIEKAGFQCQDCNAIGRLEVHHCFYRFGFEPWEYPIDSLRSLCPKCHKSRAAVEIELRARMAELKTTELIIISEFIHGGVDYYSERKIIDLIEQLNLDTEILKELITKKKGIK